jgi:hypothetical protein
VLDPLNLNVPPLTFTNDPTDEPPSAITPANVPVLSVNAVPSNVTRPVDAPSNVSNVATDADNATVPSAVTTALTGSAAPIATLNVAPFATVTDVDANRPVPVNASVPALTAVEPVYVLAPLKLNVPPLTFTNDPANEPPSAITPSNDPSPNVNAVPSNVTNPVVAPFNVNKVADTADNATVPSAVTTALTGNAAPCATLNVAPAATVTAVDANRPVPVNASVPASTLVDPVNVFTPPKLNIPVPTFTNEPVEEPSRTTPANVPSLNVNVVPSNVTRPVEAPSNVSNVTAGADSSNVPSTVNAAVAGTEAPLATLIVAPAATVNAVDAKLPLPVNANVPAFTLVAPV